MNEDRNKIAIRVLSSLINDGRSLSGWVNPPNSDFIPWKAGVIHFLTTTFDKDDIMVKTFLDNVDFSSKSAVITGVNVLDRIKTQLEEGSREVSIVTTNPAAADTNAVLPTQNKNIKTQNLKSNRIFLVHGHDEELKQSVARFLEKGGLSVVILHEKPNMGSKAIYQKLQSNSEVEFAIILLSPDDVGKDSTSKDELQTRARQNVVLELGYFLGKLSADKVCAINRNVKEIPGDYGGIVYITYDEHYGWQRELSKELLAAGLKFDMNKAILGE